METAGNLLPSSAVSRQGDRQEGRGEQEQQPPRTEGIWRSDASVSRHLLLKQHGALVF